MAIVTAAKPRPPTPASSKPSASNARAEKTPPALPPRIPRTPDAKCFTISLRPRPIVRILGEAARYFLITLAILYALDFAIFHVRGGSALSTVAVDQFLSTPLKGNKAEYDYLGTANQPCSRTLFPQYASSAWNPPCWWLQHHNASWQ